MCFSEENYFSRQPLAMYIEQSAVNIFCRLGCIGSIVERNIAQNIVHTLMKIKGAMIMLSKKEVISFRSFMDRSYKRKKGVQLYSQKGTIHISS